MGEYKVSTITAGSSNRWTFSGGRNTLGAVPQPRVGLVL